MPTGIANGHAEDLFVEYREVKKIAAHDLRRLRACGSFVSGDERRALRQETLLYYRSLLYGTFHRVDVVRLSADSSVHRKELVMFVCIEATIGEVQITGKGIVQSCQNSNEVILVVSSLIYFRQQHREFAIEVFGFDHRLAIPSRDCF